MKIINAKQLKKKVTTVLNILKLMSISVKKLKTYANIVL